MTHRFACLGGCGVPICFIQTGDRIYAECASVRFSFALRDPSSRRVRVDVHCVDCRVSQLMTNEPWKSAEERVVRSCHAAGRRMRPDALCGRPGGGPFTCRGWRCVSGVCGDEMIRFKYPLLSTTRDGYAMAMSLFANSASVSSSIGQDLYLVPSFFVHDRTSCSMRRIGPAATSSGSTTSSMRNMH